MSTTTTNLRGQITEYSNFINRTLRPQLQKAVDEREETEAEISEFLQLQTKLKLLVERDTRMKIESKNNNNTLFPIDTIVDICHGAVYCNATIPNPRTIYIDVGLGFHVEMTLHEAIIYINKRVDHIEKNVLKHRVKVATTVAKDVENAIKLMEELGVELADMER
jgi:prefoldin subunit 5